MKLRFVLASIPLALVPATFAGAQDLRQDVAAFVATPAVTGYEQELANKIRERLKNLPVETDNLGNVYITLGRGAPHRLVVTPMDEPGYVVSAITEDGYLRVQRLPQTAPHAVFDLLHAAQPVVVLTRRGKAVPGVVAGLSTHLQPNRQNPPRGAHPDEMYIDIGASSAAEVRAAGVELLDPLALERTLLDLGFGRMAGVSAGDRFGCAALVQLLRRIDPAKLHGTLTVAFVAQQWADSRGLDRLARHVAADEMIYVGRLLPRRGTPGRSGQGGRPQMLPGSGVVVGVAELEAPLAGLAAELRQLAEQNKIPMSVDFSAPLARSRYSQGPPLPERFAHLAIPTKFPTTPAEAVQIGDLEHLARLIELYVGAILSGVPPGGGGGTGDGPYKRTGPPALVEILKELVETYGVSEKEGPVREAIRRLLPPWAKPETDPAGNLVLHIGAGAGPKAPRIAFVAHMDEIGYAVRAINPDGTLEVQSRGGGISEFFLGHPVLIHTAKSARAGVLELPAGWDQPGFEWPRAAPAGTAPSYRVDTGARSAAEVEQLGIRIGDTISVPKKYRPLVGRRANGRSFDDRVGCTALVAAAWALGPGLPGRDITLIWSTEEELGLRGALAAAQRMAQQGRVPDYVFAIDTFVSSDSPLESNRFADAPIGKGFVVRAVDNSNITARKLVDRVIALARANGIPAQLGVTGGGNDGAAFAPYGSVNVPLGWPLRYSHSPGEVVDTRDVEALARIVAVIARSW